MWQTTIHVKHSFDMQCLPPCFDNKLPGSIQSWIFKAWASRLTIFDLRALINLFHVGGPPLSITLSVWFSHASRTHIPKLSALWSSNRLRVDIYNPNWRPSLLNWLMLRSRSRWRMSTRSSISVMTPIKIYINFMNHFMHADYDWSSLTQCSVGVIFRMLWTPLWMIWCCSLHKQGKQ